MESEADHIGLMLMAAAGYDPRAQASTLVLREDGADRKAAGDDAVHEHASVREEARGGAAG